LFPENPIILSKQEAAMLKTPQLFNEPDFNVFKETLSGKRKPDRIVHAEVLVDEEIKKIILEQGYGEKYYPPVISQWGTGSSENLDTDELKRQYGLYFKQTIRFWYLMGYSLFTDLTFISNFEAMNVLEIKTADTAKESKGERYWAVEGEGMINSWKDFEEFPWDRAYRMIDEYETYLVAMKEHLPEGMKIGVVASLFEELLEWLFGYERFFYMLIDNPDLVQAVNDKVGTLLYDFYERTIPYDIVGCIFHADDLGYKNDTLISVEHLKQYTFPWFKKYADLAHRYNKPFYLHSCGKKEKIMDILIDEVGIDGIHAFEEVSYPVAEYKTRWGERVGIIGGIDVDALVRSSEDALRAYVRETLDVCTRNGRYVFGSGNSIANYIPVENYLAMIDEANKWHA
jgi:uroporphyrinogen decarboxylase